MVSLMGEPRSTPPADSGVPDPGLVPRQSPPAAARPAPPTSSAVAASTPATTSAATTSAVAAPADVGAGTAAAAPAAAAPAAVPAADPAVLIAVGLGWSMAELYAAVRPRDLRPPPVPEHPRPAPPPADSPGRIQLQADLPGAGALQDRQEFALIVDQVRVGVHALGRRITHAGLVVPEHEDWFAMAARRGDPEADYQLARSVLLFHDALIIVLTAADHQLGVAYGLGRAVADLTLRMSPALLRTRAEALAPPGGAERAGAADPRLRALTEDLRDGRVDAISGWLKELHTVLPPHVAGAVSGSIRQWKQWAARPVWQGQPLDWRQHGREVERALSDQGKRWRLLLTGQADPLDQLRPEDYVQAAGYFVGRVRQILERLIVQYWPWVALATVAMVGGVVGSLVLLHSSGAKGLGVAISVFGWLGLTGRTLSGALQRTTGHVESSLWQAELDLAAAWANTMLPDADANRQLREAPPPRFRLLPRRARQSPASAGAPPGRAPAP